MNNYPPPTPGKPIFMLRIHNPKGIVVMQCGVTVDDPNSAAEQATLIGKDTGYKVEAFATIALCAYIPPAIEVIP